MSETTVPVRKWAVPAFLGPDALELMDASLPATPRRGNVRVRVLATTSTYTDQMILQGTYSPLPPLPVTPGYDLVGVVEAVGEGVTSLTPGMRVAAMPQAGCAATRVELPQKYFVPVRDDVDPVDAVGVVLTGVTAYQMLHRCSGRRLSPDAKLLVHGVTGGTGAMIVELAKIAGVPAANIFGTCSGRNLPAAAALGVTAFDYATQDWVASVRAATGGVGVDLVFDSVLLGGYLSRSIACLARGGKVLCFGATNTQAAGKLAVGEFVGALARIASQQYIASWFSGKEAEFYHVGKRFDAKPAEFAADLHVLMDLVATRRLHPLVGGRVWSFEEVKLALQGIAGNRHVGKQIIRVASDSA